MAPGVHDEVMARVSHLPHLIAYALVAAVGPVRIEGREPLEYAGSGFRDTTRIAGSPAGLWRDVALANADAVHAALAEFRSVLDRIDRLLATRDGAGLEAALAEARTLRRRLGGGD